MKFKFIINNNKVNMSTKYQIVNKLFNEQQKQLQIKKEIKNKLVSKNDEQNVCSSQIHQIQKK